MVSSIDDLTAQVDQQGLTTLEQQRVLALSGLVPDGHPGSLYRFRGSRSPFTAIGISGLAKSSGSGQRVSYYVQREIESTVSEDELVQLRNKLIDVRLKASELIRRRLERVQAAAAAQPDTNALATLKNEIKTAQDAFDAAWRSVVESVNKPGMMIIRTDKSSSQSLAGKLGSILGLSSDRDQDIGGFAILAGLRTSFLYVGNDLESEHWAQPFVEDWNLIGTSFPYVIGTVSGWVPIPGQCNYEDIHVVTSQFQAKHVLYVRDSLTEGRIQANLKASVEQLKNFKQTLQEVDEVAIDAVLASVESLGNLGILGVAKENVLRLDQLPAPDADQERWQTVYQVLTDYDDLRSFSDGHLRMHLTNWW